MGWVSRLANLPPSWERRFGRAKVSAAERSLSARMERSEIRDQPFTPTARRSFDAPPRISLRSIRATLANRWRFVWCGDDHKRIQEGPNRPCRDCDRLYCRAQG